MGDVRRRGLAGLDVEELAVQGKGSADCFLGLLFLRGEEDVIVVGRELNQTFTPMEDPDRDLHLGSILWPNELRGRRYTSLGLEHYRKSAVLNEE
jgi:hypothetical protein